MLVTNYPTKTERKCECCGRIIKVKEELYQYLVTEPRYFIVYVCLSRQQKSTSNGQRFEFKNKKGLLNCDK